MIQPTDQISTEERRQLHVSGLEVLGLSSQGDLSVHNASTGAELRELASSECSNTYQVMWHPVTL